MERAQVVLNIEGNSFTLVGAGASISGENVNVGSGTQINVQSDAPKDEILVAVRALVSAGLAGDWNVDAARQVEAVVDARDDIALEDVQEVTAEVVKEEAGTQTRGREFRDKVLASGLGGALSHGIIAGFAQILPLLPRVIRTPRPWTCCRHPTVAVRG